MIHFSHCHPENPTIVCPGRYEAVRAGRFWWDHKVHGYVTTDIPPRKQSSAARWFGGERGIEDHTGELYRLEKCPYCSMNLADLHTESEMSVTDGEQDAC